MASGQLSRQDNVRVVKGVEVEKDLVPKMASRYETLTEKAKKPQDKEFEAKDARKDDNKIKKSGDVMGHAREKASAVKDAAGETLGSDKDVVTGLTEKKTKELVFDKEDEGRDQQEAAKRHDVGGERAHRSKEGRIGGILGAVGETLVDIASSTKDLVFGKRKDDHDDDEGVVYDLGYGRR